MPTGVMSEGKTRVKALEPGARILVRKYGADVVPAGSRKDAMVATVTELPQRAAPPPGSVNSRSGFSIVTDLGVIAFVTSVQGLLVARKSDERKARREAEDGARAAEEAERLLGNGMYLTPEESAAAVRTAKRPTNGKKLAGADDLPAAPSPVQVLAHATRSAFPLATHKDGLANYAELARHAPTLAARLTWQGLLEEAETLAAQG